MSPSCLTGGMAARWTTEHATGCLTPPSNPSRRLGKMVVSVDLPETSAALPICANKGQAHRVTRAQREPADTTAAAQFSTIAVKWGQPGQGGDLLAIEHSQFGQLREQSTREHLTDPGHGTQQLVALTPEGSIANQLGEFIVETGKSLFNQRMCSSML